MDIKKGIGERLRHIRKHIGMTQKEAAEIFDMDQSNFARMEKGITFPNMHVCHYFRKNYKVNINWLVTGEGAIFLPEVEEKEQRADYGEFNEEMEEMLFYLNHVPKIRYEIIKFFNTYKIEHKKEIVEYLKKNKIKRRWPHENVG